MAIAEPAPRKAARELAATYPRRSTAAKPHPRTFRARIEATPERARHGEIVERGSRRVATPQLERLRGRTQLDHNIRNNEALAQAGFRFRRHHEGAGLGPRAFDLTRIGGGNRSYEPSTGRLEHLRQLQIVTALLGGTAGLRYRVIEAVVIEDRTLEETGKAVFGGPSKPAKARAGDALRTALFILATHWGLA